MRAVKAAVGTPATQPPLAVRDLRAGVVDEPRAAQRPKKYSAPQVTSDLAALPGVRRSDEGTNRRTSHGQELDTTTKQEPADRNENARRRKVSVNAYVSPKSEISKSRDGPACGDADTGDCCIANGSPYCEDADCCSTVCAVDPFCCGTEWDACCAGEAADLCTTCAERCAPVCAGTETPGGEANCGLPDDTFNGGCSSTPNVFSSISCGDEICGTAAWDCETRDTDWYEITVVTDTEFTFTVNSEFNFIFGKVDVSDCALMNSIDPFASGPCNTPVSITTCLAAGKYWFFVAPDFDGPSFACGADYTARLECVGCNPTRKPCCLP